ncbi:hypothetical protein EV200_11190 [Pedobacter psychrotolerans]|uniref:DUF6973 domain-containing protein n=1 Tax=Pedobacter psychrotolerans TaxID=1843235 RepID=A0A4R2H2C7_9SPHI|nr:hypothetical protein [Pedobacter psychrotolerans]TCO18752.1 hypothetical protein EV200_11190 [Pedobacter psychrotolerans]GGE70472.1 hypothetical protein GCM10011413_41470 [Pedobacter psychrotolerans]
MCSLIPKTVRICAGPYPGSPLEACYYYPIGEECIDYCAGAPTTPPGGTVPGDSGLPPDGSVAYTIELQTFEVGYKAQMKPGELVIFNNMTRINQLRYLVNAQGAIDLANELFPVNQLNTKADSFRHAYFSLWNTYSINRDLAKQLGDAHEEGTTNNPMEEMAKSMDLWNNYAGRNLISSINSSSLNRRNDFKNLVLSLMNAGELKYMKLVGLEYYLVYTNE